MKNAKKYRYVKTGDLAEQLEWWESKVAEYERWRD